MKKRVLLSFFAFQQNLIKCEVKIYLESILVAKDIQEVSTFASKKYPLSCLSTITVGGDSIFTPQEFVKFTFNELLDTEFYF